MSVQSASSAPAMGANVAPLPATATRPSSYDMKLERAKEHLFNLYAEIVGFLNTNPYGVILEGDAKPGHSRAEIAFSDPAPPRILIIAGDILHNLRGALDHLYWELTHSRPSARPSDESARRKIQFPIFDSAEAYRANRSKIGRLGPDVLKMFNNLKPYHGGNDAIWRLNRLSNIDKHRALLTVAIDARELRILKQAPSPPISEVADGSALVDYTTVTLTPPFPLNDGAVFASGLGKSEKNYNVQLSYGIAFNEPGIAERMEVISTFQELIYHVDVFIKALAPLI